MSKHSGLGESIVTANKIKKVQTTHAWILTREWRDTPDGLELVFWASSDLGPVRLIYRNSKAVCFIDRASVGQNTPERKPVALSTLQNRPVDALYFKKQAELKRFAQSAGIEIFESDVKPTDRFLMERFITGAVEIQGELMPGKHYYTVSEAKLSGSDYRPSLRIMSLDIETDYKSNEILSIAALLYHKENQCEKVFVLSKQRIDIRSGLLCEASPNEEALLNDFIRWLCKMDPDVLIGWNVINFDMSILQERCQLHGLPFALGRGGKNATILQPTQTKQTTIARIPGRVVLDGIETLRSAFWNFESYALDYVANALLNKGKLINEQQDRAEKILDLYQSDKAKLAEYNIEDCRLVRDIFDKTDLLNFALERASVTGLAFGRNGGSVAAFDFLYLPRLHRKGFVAPDANPDQSGGLSSPGGYVLDSRPGLYKNVLVLDFKSLYPSIIRTFLIDPLGLHLSGEDTVPGYDGARFSREQKILPDLIAGLWQKRDQAKHDNNAAMSQAVKIIMNSFYGVLGTSACRFYNPLLTSSITKRGHDIILKTRDLISERGHQVIYGDTDSVFIWLEGKVSREQARTTGNELATRLNAWWKQYIHETYRLKNYLELEFETHFQRFLMPTVRGSSAGSKKRYAGSVVHNNGTQSLVFKGLETVRSDWTPLAREFQRELFSRIFTDEPYEDYIRSTVSRMHDGDFDDKLHYRKRIRQSLHDYRKNIPPHIQAARQMEKPGRWIEYFITVGGPQAKSLLSTKLDYSHYQEKQLKPVADTILQFVGSQFDDIVSGQLDIF